MNAEEFKSVLRKLKRTIGSVRTHVAWASDLALLNEAWDKLDQHRREMEAAESKPVTAGRIRDVELRTTWPTCHMEADDVAPPCNFEAIDGRFVDQAKRINRNARSLDAIEKRLGKIETEGAHTVAQIGLLLGELQGRRPDYLGTPASGQTVDRG